MAYLKNTITNFTRNTVDGYSVCDYRSIDFNAIRVFINSLNSDYFDLFRVNDDDKWERIALELYGAPDYWDILMVLNQRNPLTGLPFNFDTISALADDKVLEYGNFVYGKSVPNVESEIMYNYWEADLEATNESNRVIKIIRPSQINAFLQLGFDQGVF